MDAPVKATPEIIHQEEVDALQDPIASAVVVKWALEGKCILVPRGAAHV